MNAVERFYRLALLTERLQELRSLALVLQNDQGDPSLTRVDSHLSRAVEELEQKLATEYEALWKELKGP
jgi:hypothetical protein